MKLALTAFTRKGADLAGRLARALEGEGPDNPNAGGGPRGPAPAFLVCAYLFLYICS